MFLHKLQVAEYFSNLSILLSFCIKKLIDTLMISQQVSQARPLIRQADILKEEMENALKSEYSVKSLPLLLQQVRSLICIFFFFFFFFSKFENTLFIYLSLFWNCIEEKSIYDLVQIF